MTASILYDQSNTVLRMGTGIATYARNLALAARAAGYGTDLLLSSDAKLDPRNPVLSEVTLFDAPRPPVLPWLKPTRDFIRGVVRAPFGYRPALLERADVVVRTAE